MNNIDYQLVMNYFQNLLKIFRKNVDFFEKLEYNKYISI